MSRDTLAIPYRETREYRDACKRAAKQRASMRYKVAAVDYVVGLTASTACRRGA